MMLTPLDIHQKEFRHSVKGYNEQEVDTFLDLVADELERLLKENIDLSEKNEQMGERIRSYQDMEKTLHNTMLTAQRAAEEITDKARAESQVQLRDAEIRAKEIIHNALTSKQQVANELVRIKNAEEEFRSAFRAVLEKYVSTLAEVRLPEEVKVMIGQTDEGVVGSVDVGAPQVAGPASVPAAPQAVAPAAGVGAAEPPAPGFVTAVSLGEVESPELEPDVSYAPAREFGLPTFGEREDDMDIEEID